MAARPAPSPPTAPAALVWSALAIVYVVWGSTYLAIRYAIGSGTGERGLPPLVMAGVRFFAAGLVLYAWAIRRPAPDGEPDPIGRPQWIATAIVGSSLLLGGNGLVVLAEQRVESYIAAVLIAMVPIWVALISFLRGGERVTRTALAGLVLGFAGVVVLANPTGATHIDLLGVVMVLAASLSWSIGSYYARSAPLPRRPLVMTGMEMMCGGVALSLVALVTGDWARLDLGAVGPKAWIAFAYLGVFGSLVAFTAYAWLLRNTSLSLVTTYAYVNPLVAVALGALLLAETVTPRTLVASGFIVVGVALIVSVRRAAEVAREEPGPAVGADVSVPAGATD